MVRPKGLEPLAHGLGNRCSIHLSYGRMIMSWVRFGREHPPLPGLPTKKGENISFPFPQVEPPIFVVEMVRPEGFEPPTSRFVACHSIQLSYGR